MKGVEPLKTEVKININKVKSLRVYNEMNQIEFAEAVEIPVSCYRNKETGKVGFTLDEAKRIADFLGLTIDELFFN